MLPHILDWQRTWRWPQQEIYVNRLAWIHGSAICQSGECNHISHSVTRRLNLAGVKLSTRPGFISIKSFSKGFRLKKCNIVHEIETTARLINQNEA